MVLTLNPRFPAIGVAPGRHPLEDDLPVDVVAAVPGQRVDRIEEEGGT